MIKILEFFEMLLTLPGAKNRGFSLRIKLVSSFFYFLIGLTIGLFFWNYTRRKAKKDKNLLSDQKIKLQQEKEIVVNFMHNLAVAIGEGVQRKDLYQRITHTAVITTGAISACVYEKMPNGKLQSIAGVQEQESQS